MRTDSSKGRSAIARSPDPPPTPQPDPSPGARAGDRIPSGCFVPIPGTSALKAETRPRPVNDREKEY